MSVSMYAERPVVADPRRLGDEIHPRLLNGDLRPGADLQLGERSVCSRALCQAQHVLPGQKGCSTVRAELNSFHSASFLVAALLATYLLITPQATLSPAPAFSPWVSDLA